MNTSLLSVAVVALGLASVANAQEPTIAQQVMDMAAHSSCAAINWKDRGVAPKAFMRGTALSYAKALCHPELASVAQISKAAGTDAAALKTDSLAWYEPQFTALHMSNASDGRDTLRHTFLLMIGLAQRESSGQHCVGRDMSADFVSHDTAEAGLYQTSWGSRKANAAVLEAMTSAYDANPSACLLDVFSKGVSCSASNAKNWGDGPGVAWQKLTKQCPAFATDYAAIVVRQGGGKTGEFGPIRRHEAELAPACDTMLQEVEKLVLAKPENCRGF